MFALEGLPEVRDLVGYGPEILTGVVVGFLVLTFAPALYRGLRAFVGDLEEYRENEDLTYRDWSEPEDKQHLRDQVLTRRYRHGDDRPAA